MIRWLACLACLLFSCISFAGPEVPWPEDLQREVQIKDMDGLWVSKNISTPQRAFQIKIQEVDFDASCPYVATISELSPFTGEVKSKDMDVICSSLMRKVIFVLTDELGQARQQVEIVGLWKGEDATETGKQYLGITVYNYGEFKEVILKDTFYKTNQ